MNVGLSFEVREGEILTSNGADNLFRSSARSRVWSRRRPVWRDTEALMSPSWPTHRLAREGLVMVPEGRRIFALLTVEANPLVGGYSMRSAAKRRDTVNTVYDLFPVLADRRDGRARLLKRGDPQMLAFGRALKSNPELVLLDEPRMGFAQPSPVGSGTR